MTDATRIAELATLIRVLKREVAELEPRIVSVKAQLAASEAELLNLQPARQPKAEPDEPNNVDESGLRTDGPTVQEYVDHGFLASGYPPKGYASRSTPEEVAAAIAAQEHTAGNVAQESALTPPAGENLDPSQSTETSSASDADQAPAPHDEAQA